MEVQSKQPYTVYEQPKDMLPWWKCNPNQLFLLNWTSCCILTFLHTLASVDYYFYTALSPVHCFIWHKRLIKLGFIWWIIHFAKNVIYNHLTLSENTETMTGMCQALFISLHKDFWNPQLAAGSNRDNIQHSLWICFNCFNKYLM